MNNYFTTQKKFKLFYNNIIKFLLIYLFGIFFFTIFRVLLYINYSGNEDLTNRGGEIITAFIRGFRFDTIIVLYGLIGVMILNIIISLIPLNKSRADKVFKITCLTFVPFVYILYFFIHLIDYFFYQFFQTHFNALLFCFFESDTKEVIVTMWTDYPTIRLGLLIICFIFLVIYGLKKILKLNLNFDIKNKIFRTLFVITVFIGFAFGIRGTFDTFPLRKDDLIISNNNFINNLIPNSVYALKDAIKDKTKYKVEITVGELLKQYSYKSIKEPFDTYFRKIKSNNYDSLLFSVTDKNIELESDKPNVIYFQMESMGTIHLKYHSKELNLLGELENQMPYCKVFKNFLSWGNATHISWEGLLVNSPRPNIPRTKFINNTFNTSIAIPFFNNNYETEYFSAGKLGWRNTGNFIKNQKFNLVHGMEDIKKNIKNTSANELGIFDGFMFDYVYKRLEENDKNHKKLFAFAMTLTNHTPYYLPKNYKVYPIHPTKEFFNKTKVDKKLTIKDLEGYQYASDCLGRFIKKIRESKFANNTIVIASGDHNNRNLFNYSNEELFIKRGVPLIMYIPKKYLKNKTIDITRFGSHKDIFPTVINLALPNTKYFNSGYDLFSNKKLPFFAYNSQNICFNKKGGCKIFRNIKYTWSKSKIRHLVLEKNKNINIDNLKKRAKAYYFIMNYAIVKNFKLN